MEDRLRRRRLRAEREPQGIVGPIRSTAGAAQPGPARYFPIERGGYAPTPGLFPFGADFGNGPADRHAFQIDADYATYRAAKLAARAERLSKYYVTHCYEPRVAQAITQFIAERLATEHPQQFELKNGRRGARILNCRLSGEALFFDHRWELIGTEPHHPPGAPEYTDALDALAAQLQEDLAVISTGRNGAHWLSAAHLCYPNYWAAEEKIGKDFAAIHAPVPEMDPIRRKAAAIVGAMIHRGPFVRFAWGLTTDTRLNHHPAPPPEVEPSRWYGRCFDPDQGRLYLRIERQGIWGLAEVGAALFTIRTYFTDCAALRRDRERTQKLRSAVASMSAETLRYKGLESSRDAILAWLAAGG